MRLILVFNLAFAAVLAFSALIFTPHGQAAPAESGKAQAFEKLDYGPDLYGLPHLGGHHESAAYERLVEGAPYGLPFAGGYHGGEVKAAWEKLDYGDDLFGLPHIGAYHGAASRVAERGDNACASARC